DMVGPVTLVRGDVTEEKIKIAARLTARYGKSNVLPSVKVSVKQVNNDAAVMDIEVVPMRQEEADKLILTKQNLSPCLE
ncbi:MAG: hypothetical protein AAB332_06065, partial [Planctomycetota bacterium]